MSDTNEPGTTSFHDSAEPLNDSAELRDAIRSIGAIGEDRTGVEDETNGDESDASDDDAVTGASDAS
jgi:hypothetical protein